MADKDIIQKRKAKFSNQTPTQMRQQMLDEEEAKKPKNLLGALTDVESLMKYAVGGALALGGAPEAGAALVGLDVLKAPREMAASENKKEERVTQAKSDVVSAKETDIQTNLQVYNQNPHAYIMAMILDGASNEEISRSLGLPEEVSYAWNAMIEKSDRDRHVDELVGKLYETAQKADSTGEAASLYLQAFELKYGDTIDHDALVSISKNLAEGETDLQDLIPPGNFTNRSTLEFAKLYRAGERDPNKLLDTLTPLENTAQYQIRHNEEVLKASGRIAEILAESVDYNELTGEYSGGMKFEEALAQLTQEDGRLGAVARGAVEEMGYAGGALSNEDLFAQAYFAETEAARRENADRAMLGLDPITPSEVLERAMQAVDNTVKYTETTSMVEANALYQQLDQTISSMGYVPSSPEAEFLRRKSIDDASVMLEGTEPTAAKLNDTASKLLRKNKDKYEAMLLKADLESEARPSVEAQPLGTEDIIETGTGLLGRDPAFSK